MSATAATAKKQKPLKRHPSKLKQASAYTILTLILISIVAVTFAFPLYWIITGSFKTGAAINSTTPEWWPHEWVLTNYQKLFAGKSAPLWQLRKGLLYGHVAEGYGRGYGTVSWQRNGEIQDCSRPWHASRAVCRQRHLHFLGDSAAGLMVLPHGEL